jgi:hypothetical protein
VAPLWVGPIARMLPAPSYSKAPVAHRRLGPEVAVTFIRAAQIEANVSVKQRDRVHDSAFHEGDESNLVS